LSPWTQRQIDRETTVKQEDRIANTESLFRDVNERIAESAQRFDAPAAQFVCECADPACTEKVHAPLDDYEEVRADGTHFLLALGHENEHVERVIECRRRFEVVEKFNRAVVARVRRLNPRARPA
jgi:hypothetical protein